MDEYIMNQNQGRLDYGLNNSYMKSAGSNLTQSLKNHVKEMRSELKKKDEEVTKIKRTLKATNIQELEVEMKLYVDECTRLRHMLEESYKNQMDPAELQKLQEQFQMQDTYLVNLQSENQELAETCAKMQQIMQNQQEDKEHESKTKSKLTKLVSNKKKMNKNLKIKDRELKQLKNDLVVARQASKGGSSVAKSMNERLIKYERELEDKNKLVRKAKGESENKDNIIEQLRQQVQQMEAGGVVSKEQVKHRENKVDSFKEQVNHRENRQDDNEEQEEEQNEQYTENYNDQDEQDEQDDEEYKDDDYHDSGFVEEDPQVEDDQDKDDQIKGERKPVISIETVSPLFQKLKLCLQNHNISYKNISKMLPSKITIIQLEHKLKSLGIKDAEERLTLCRYIIEPRSDIIIEFNENREISEVDAIKVLKSVIEPYQTYEKEEEEMKGRVKEQVGRFTSTLKDALECEDLDSTGFIQANTLKGCFHAMDINLDSDLIDYLIYLSGTTEKIGKTNHLWLEYSKISDFVEGLADDGAYDRKVSDLLKDDNDASDDYGNDFEEPKSEPK
jgi:hypothetical protein